MSVTVDTGMTPVGIAAILAGTRTGHDDRRQAGEGSRRRDALRGMATPRAIPRRWTLSRAALREMANPVKTR